MNDLISRKYLYDKMLEKEELARQRVLDTPTHSPAYLRYVAQLNERTALKHEIADAPVIEAPTWIPCSERLPDDGENVLVWFEYFRYGDYNRLFQTTGISYVFDGEWSGFVNGSSGWSKLRIIAWLPLPEPYKGE